MKKGLPAEAAAGMRGGAVVVIADVVSKAERDRGTWYHAALSNTAGLQSLTAAILRAIGLQVRTWKNGDVRSIGVLCSPDWPGEMESEDEEPEEGEDERTGPALL